MTEKTTSGDAPEKPKSAPKTAAQLQAEARLSPREHALATGHGPKGGKSNFTASMGGRAFQATSAPRGSASYEVAKMAHGWREHEHHTGSPLLMTQTDFLKALEAASTYNAKGESLTHAPALSPHKGKAC